MVYLKQDGWSRPAIPGISSALPKNDPGAAAYQTSLWRIPFNPAAGTVSFSQPSGPCGAQHKTGFFKKKWKLPPSFSMNILQKTFPWKIMPCPGIWVSVGLSAASSATTGLRLCSILSISGSQMQKPCSALQPTLSLRWLQLWAMRTLCISADCSKTDRTSSFWIPEHQHKFSQIKYTVPVSYPKNKTGTCRFAICHKYKPEVPVFIMWIYPYQYGPRLGWPAGWLFILVLCFQRNCFLCLKYVAAGADSIFCKLSAGSKDFYLFSTFRTYSLFNYWSSVLAFASIHNCHMFFLLW